MLTAVAAAAAVAAVAAAEHQLQMGTQQRPQMPTAAGSHSPGLAKQRGQRRSSAAAAEHSSAAADAMLLA